MEQDDIIQGIRLQVNLNKRGSQLPVNLWVDKIMYR